MDAPPEGDRDMCTTALRSYEPFRREKAGWADGPWRDEADKQQWIDESTGLDAMYRRCTDGGYLCGYVGVEQGHPLFGWRHDAIPTELGVTAHRGIDESGICEGGDEAMARCHVPEAGRPDDVWWLGFRCNHRGDLSPMDAHRDATGAIYADVPYVKAQVGRLARALADVAAPPPQLALPAPMIALPAPSFERSVEPARA